MTLVVSNERRSNTGPGTNTFVVATPLDMIMRLEAAPDLISTIVLAGVFAANRELALFLREFSPRVHVVECVTETRRT